ncbi:transposase [Kibdelosporangium persicum]|uniref:Transposase n=1 Tax=Kibdelosporangium persicum TaxID=2698649 RepID=A0ABX2EW10_9PSEU|nr:transposase [Kibdelosporangium persicum]NRN63216.1 Transposase [Kibdelosporangium persicum]
MSDAVLADLPDLAGRPRDPLRAAILGDLGQVLFESLPRSDQRRHGMSYLQGLLTTPGRKSIRNMAARFGGPATEQSLHHFINSSTWDWDEIRRALAHYLDRSTSLPAWVVRPMVIPKSGPHSVGVDRRFSVARGHAVHAQQAVGIWAASDELSGPVNWRLRLSAAWLEDESRRSQVAIPGDVRGPETLADCAVRACVRTATGWDLPVRPVVMDVPGADPITVVRGLRAAGLRMLIRVDPGLPLTVCDPALPGHTVAPVPAGRVVAAAKGLRRPVTLPCLSAGGIDDVPRTVLAASVRVRMPASLRKTGRAGRYGELLLLAEGSAGPGRPERLWLTDMVGAHPAALLRYSGLIRRVDQDFSDIAEPAGIRDFAGRSYGGWHRHITLASAAHSVGALAGLAERRKTIRKGNQTWSLW